MAVVGTVTYKELTGEHGKTVFSCALTGATSTITAAIHKLSSVVAYTITPRSTNTTTHTLSGTTVTVTGTNTDTIDCVFYGKK